MSSRVYLAAASVVLALVSLPGGPLPHLALVALVPIGVALHGASVRQSVLYAYATAFLGWLGSTAGLIGAFASYAHASSVESTVVVALSCAYLALPYAGFGLLYGRFQWMTSARGAVNTAACLTLLVTAFPSPLPLDSSHALYRVPLLIQILDIGGQPLLLFTLYLFNWLCVAVIVAIRDGQRYGGAVASLLCLTLCVVAYGYARTTVEHEADGGHARIALIQPNAALGGPNPHSEEALNPFRTLLDMSARVLSDSARIDLVVWPEIPTRISCEGEAGVRPELTAIVARFGVPFLVNCVRPAPGGGDYNTELLLTPDGRRLEYHKQRLFPLTEYIPGESWIPGLRRLFPGASRYITGTQATTLPANEAMRVIPATCYELLFRNHATDFLQSGGNLIVSAANDAWFGWSRVPEFAIAASVFQAVRHRIPVVRVSNSGNSAAVSATGRLLAGSPTAAFTQMALVVDVEVSRTQPAYRFPDDAFLWLLAFVWLGGVVRDVAVRGLKGDRPPRPASR